MSCDPASDVSTFSGNASVRTLDNVGPRSFMKIYCACGRIVALDKREMNIKKSLNKELECMACRNLRIAYDIELFNECYNGEPTFE